MPSRYDPRALAAAVPAAMSLDYRWLSRHMLYVHRCRRQACAGRGDPRLATSPGGRMKDSFKARTTLACGSNNFEIFSLAALKDRNVARLPYSLKILLENLLRFEDGVNVTRADIEALLNWDPKARAVLRDLLHAEPRDHAGLHRRAGRRRPRRDARGDDQARRQSRRDQSAVARRAGHRSLGAGRCLRHARIRSRRTPRSSSSATPSATRSCAGARRRSATSRSCRRTPASCTRSTSSIWRASCSTRRRTACAGPIPDTLVGTDSHTTMVNGLGVLGWGVGGIEAEAAMLGQPVTMLIPHVIGFKLTGSLPAGATATDLVLTVTEMLRKKGVVDKFVEFFGDGLANLPLADRATIANMSPEFGSTCGIFPIDERNAALSRADRPQRRAHRAGEGLRAAPGHVARERPAAGRLHRRARARSRHGRAVARRARSVRRIACRCARRSRRIRRRTRRWPRSARRRIPTRDRRRQRNGRRQVVRGARTARC